MSSHLFMFALVGASFFSVDSKTGYAVLAPDHVLPGENYVVNVLLTKESTDTAVKSATVKASFNYPGISSEQVTVQFAGPQLGASARFEFAIPASFSASEGLILTVSSSGHITFDKQITVSKQAIPGRIYVQMDKPIYRPGDRLRFIVFGLYNNFLPITDRSINISIEDAGRNLVQSWVAVRNVTSHGVIQLELLLSTRASLGKWRINISFGDISGFYEFPVDNYKLSLFEAVIETNSTYFSRYEANNAVEALSKGLYQAPGCKLSSGCSSDERGQVTGLVEMQVWLLGTGSTKYGSINITHKAVPNKPASYVITSEALARIVDLKHIDRLLIFSKVTEAGTGYVNYANKTLPVIDNAYLLDYPKYVNPTVFHTDRPLALHMQVLRSDGKAIVKDDVNRLVTEKAASCNEDDLDNDAVFDTLPAWSVDRLASNGDVNISINTGDADLDCETIYVKIKLRQKSNRAVLHSVKKSFTRFASQANIKISWEDGTFDIRQKSPGEYISAFVESSVAVPAFQWMIVSRGLVLESGFVSRPLLQRQTLYVRIANHHLPRASLIVWTTLNDELVADALEFQVVDNKVSLDYSTGSSPADDNFGSNAATSVRSPVALRFDTLPTSFVQWLAIDERVLIHLQSKISSSAVDESELQGNNDFVPYSSRSLQENFLDVSRQLAEHLSLLGSVHKDSAANTYDVFRQSEIKLETSYANTQGLLSTRKQIAATEPTNNVRVLFPEVFLFENAIAPDSGSFIQRYTTPDTVTTWFVSALSLHPTRSIQVSNVVKIPIESNFTLSIYIPTVVYKCNESVLATVVAYNHHNVPTHVTVQANGALAYRIDGQPVDTNVTKRVALPPFSTTNVEFTYRFIEVGRHKVVITAETDEGYKDTLQTAISVKPEGVPVREDTEAVYCWNSTSCVQNVVLEPKQESCTQAALGEVVAVITPMLVVPENDWLGEDNANNLPTPEGCCEQLMPVFTDLAYVLRTLRRDGKTSAQVDAEITGRLQVALQIYLSQCARPDGSVTSWGNDYGQLGSTVLTSFVARTLLIAGNLVQDTGAIEQARRNVNWLLGHQLSEGHFPPYPPNGFLSVPYVWYTHLESGYYANSTATAYALIGILENDAIGPQYAASHRSQLLRASAYLKKTYTNTNDLHYLSITAYALRLAALRLDDSEALSVANSIQKRLEPLAFSSNGKTFWPYNRVPESCNSVLIGAIPAYPAEIEATAFIFELYFLDGNKDAGTPIFRFLLGQRNSQHKLPRMGYTTHSTALGQQAIGDYMLLASIPLVHTGTIELESVGGFSPFSVLVNITENSISPIKIPLPRGVPEVKVTSTAGLTQVYFVTLKYYQNPYHAYRAHHSGLIDTNVFASPISDVGDFATIEICNSWRSNETSGMVVSLVELQSGYSLHSTLKDIQQQHIVPGGGSLVGSLEKFNEKHFAIYYNTLPSYQRTCTEVLLRRSVIVNNLATAAVRSYVYYETNHIAFQLYKVSKDAQQPVAHLIDEL